MFLQPSDHTVLHRVGVVDGELHGGRHLRHTETFFEVKPHEHPVPRGKHLHSRFEESPLLDLLQVLQWGPAVVVKIVENVYVHRLTLVGQPVVSPLSDKIEGGPHRDHPYPGLETATVFTRELTKLAAFLVKYLQENGIVDVFQIVMGKRHPTPPERALHPPVDHVRVCGDKTLTSVHITVDAAVAYDLVVRIHTYRRVLHPSRLCAENLLLMFSQELMITE